MSYNSELSEGLERDVEEMDEEVIDECDFEDEAIEEDDDTVEDINIEINTDADCLVLEGSNFSGVDMLMPSELAKAVSVGDFVDIDDFDVVDAINAVDAVGDFVDVGDFDFEEAIIVPNEQPKSVLLEQTYSDDLDTLEGEDDYETEE